MLCVKLMVNYRPLGILLCIFMEFSFSEINIFWILNISIWLITLHLCCRKHWKPQGQITSDISHEHKHNKQKRENLKDLIRGIAQLNSLCSISPTSQTCIKIVCLYRQNLMHIAHGVVDLLFKYGSIYHD